MAAISTGRLVIGTSVWGPERLASGSKLGAGARGKLFDPGSVPVVLADRQSFPFVGSAFLM